MSIARPSLAAVRTEEPNFEQLLAAQLRHAPWLGLSLLAHGLVLTVIAMLPPPPRPGERVLTSYVPLAQDLPETPAENQPPPEPRADEPQLPLPQPTELADQPATDGQEGSADAAALDPSAFDSGRNDTGPVSAHAGTGWSTPLGLGGGAASGGGRPGRKGKAGGRAAENLAIHAGLRWLARHQDDDGKWDADEFMKHDREGQRCDGPGNAVHDVGLTGLALLAFLGDGHTLRSGTYQETVRKGVSWLKDQQQENGLLGSNASHDFVYDHAIATLALCEACGLSAHKTLRPIVQRALGYLSAHKNPYGVWRYQPRDGDNDTSVTCWAVLAYKSAKDFHFAVDERVFADTLVWLDQMTDPATGRCGYSRRGEPSSRKPGAHATRFPPEKGEAMTGAALFCRVLLGQKPEQVACMRPAVQTLAAKPPRWVEDGSIDHYAWYYSTYALYQLGGKAWQDWSKALHEAVVKTQRQDGNFHGSWDPRCVWGEDGGRVYSTAMLVLTLEAYYRYARVLVR